MKSRKLLTSFINYCFDTPEQSFWQALRNWSGYGYIYGNKRNILLNGDNPYLEDTFYKEAKNASSKMSKW